MLFYVFGFLIIFLKNSFSYEFTIIKGISYIQTYTNETYLLNDKLTENDFVFFDLDLYPNQYINMKSNRSSDKIEPINGDYYINITNLISPSHSKDRDMGNIKEIGSIKITRSNNQISIEYFDLIKPTKIVKLYFDLVISDGKKIKGVVQINIMPDVENIDKEETIELEDQKFWEFKDWLYIKEVRQGVKTNMYCKKIKSTGEPISFKKYKNPFTNVEYDILDNSIDIDKNNEGGITLDLTDDKLYARDKKLMVNCRSTTFKSIEFKNLKSKYLKGYNRFTREENSIYIKEKKYIFFKGVILFNDVPSKYLYPTDCLNEFLDTMENIVKTKEFFKGSNIVNITKSIKLLDTSKANNYSIKHLLCKYKGETPSPSMLLEIKSACNLNNTDNLDINKISCTMFMDQEINSHIFLNNNITLRKEGEDFLYYLVDEEITLESRFIKIPDYKYKYINIGKDVKDLKPYKARINHNPIYLLFEDKNKDLKNIVRIYLYNDKVEDTDKVEYGKEEDKTKLTSKLILYRNKIQYPNILRVQFNTNRIIIRCSDLFLHDKNKNQKLFPNGKNTIYRNIDDTKKHYTEFEKIQLEELFGIKGITILKKPETNNDLEIFIDKDYEIITEHYRPIYFICAKEQTLEEWRKNPENYIVIGIDPIYKNIKYNGCGINTHIFEKTNENCDYNLKYDKNTRIYCPDYVPEHFLTDNQEQYKSDSIEISNENPFKKLIRCYNRSSFLNRLFKTKNEVNILEKRNTVSELRSIYKIDESLMKNLNVTTALCVCYNKNGEPKSLINVNI